jgi:NAD(P)-dependent dehydrogenase (short-subunit alcohol dehydrogenase family)
LKTIQELISLKGRRALITGATGNIGKNFAITIAELGGDLVLTDIPGSDYSNLKKEIGEISDVDIETFDCQLEDAESRAQLILFVMNSNKSLNILINNAAFVGTSDLSGWATDFESQTIETWMRALEVNLTAGFDLCKGLSKKLQSSRSGSIINIASIYGSNAPDYSLYEGTNMANPAAYSASKGGLIQLTRWLSSTMAPTVRVNSISFGGLLRNQNQKFIQRYIQQIPLDRMACEEDVKGIICYLASDMSLYVTGQDFIVDGGWSV